MSAVAKIWSERILMGSKTFNEVPAKLQDEVKQILRDNGYTVGEDGEAVSIAE